MRAYLIDPQAGEITQVDYTGDYRNIYQHIGADCFDVARFGDEGDAAFVDDNGLLNDPRYFFMVRGNPNPLAGKGLVLGCDAEGESIEPKCTLEWLKANVAFCGELIPGTGMFAVLGPSDMAAELARAFSLA
jgi:hypothetical protein